MSELTNAASFLVSTSEHVPRGEWLDSLRQALRERGDVKFKCDLRTIDAALSDPEAAPDGPVDMIKAVQSFLAELSLAFPMEEFPHEYQTDLATVMHKKDSRVFHV
jgi:hypothetical protein